MSLLSGSPHTLRPWWLSIPYSVESRYCYELVCHPLQANCRIFHCLSVLAALSRAFPCVLSALHTLCAPGGSHPYSETRGNVLNAAPSDFTLAEFFLFCSDLSVFHVLMSAAGKHECIVCDAGMSAQNGCSKCVECEAGSATIDDQVVRSAASNRSTFSVNASFGSECTVLEFCDHLWLH